MKNKMVSSGLWKILYLPKMYKLQIAPVFVMWQMGCTQITWQMVNSCKHMKCMTPACSVTDVVSLGGIMWYYFIA